VKLIRPADAKPRLKNMPQPFLPTGARYKAPSTPAGGGSYTFEREASLPVENNIPTLDNSGACPMAESRRLMKHGTQATSSASHCRDPAASIAANPVLAEATLASSIYL
jgi:hypothetical protein